MDRERREQSMWKSSGKAGGKVWGKAVEKNIECRGKMSFTRLWWDFFTKNSRMVKSFTYRFTQVLLSVTGRFYAFYT